MKWIIAAVVAVIGLYVIWNVAYPSGTIRYRLTVEFEVDGQVRSGSGVVEVTYRRLPRVINAGVDTYVKGEAFAVDLGGRGKLFVLLDSADPIPFLAMKEYYSDPESIPAAEFFGRTVGGLRDETIRSLDSFKGKKEIPFERLPRIVNFVKLDDPSSVRPVRAGDIQNLFGPSARFKRAILESTRDPVTVGILKELNWAGNYRLEAIFERRLRELNANHATGSVGLKLRKGF